MARIRESASFFVRAHVEFDPFVDEAQQTADGVGVVARFGVGPDDVGFEPLPDPQRPVVGGAFVGAAGGGVAGLQQIGAHFLGGR